MIRRPPRSTQGVSSAASDVYKRQEFEQWLECYREDAEYWMPAWDVDDTLTTDPQSEISLIYYPDRSGLEDRVFRIRTERSSATSIPEPRTNHNITNVEILERRDGEVDVRFNWISYYFRYNHTDHYFGTTFVTLDTSGKQPVIAKKKICLLYTSPSPRDGLLSRMPSSA